MNDHLNKVRTFAFTCDWSATVSVAMARQAGHLRSSHLRRWRSARPGRRTCFRFYFRSAFRSYRRFRQHRTVDSIENEFVSAVRLTAPLRAEPEQINPAFAVL